MHLTLEALARLVDEPAAPGEAAHLRDCLVCHRELAALRAQTEALAELAGGPPRAAGWDALRGRLEAEGLIVAARRPRVPVRIAAAVALLLVGGAGGALLRAAPGGAEPRSGVVAGATRSPTVEARPAGRPTGAPEVIYITEPEALPVAASGARLASSGAPPLPRVSVPGPRTAPDPAPVRAPARDADRAVRDLLEAQAAFIVALERLAAVADPRSGNEASTRLAALDRLVQLTAAALDRAPGDPVVNGYHLAAVAERDALRREIERDARTAWF